jgi:hypothetical protein
MPPPTSKGSRCSLRLRLLETHVNSANRMTRLDYAREFGSHPGFVRRRRQRSFHRWPGFSGRFASRIQGFAAGFSVSYERGTGQHRLHHALPGCVVNQLLIIFDRDGVELERRVARDGERAAMMAALLIAELGVLQPGDLLSIEED